MPPVIAMNPDFSSGFRSNLFVASTKSLLIRKSKATKRLLRRAPQKSGALLAMTGGGVFLKFSSVQKYIFKKGPLIPNTLMVFDNYK